jgi:hypothetical protein
MLVNFEEEEDMVCAICMDFMSVGDIIVKTKCGTDILLPADVEEVILKGHKFHKECFKSWLKRG